MTFRTRRVRVALAVLAVAMVVMLAAASWCRTSSPQPPAEGTPAESGTPVESAGAGGAAADGAADGAADAAADGTADIADATYYGRLFLAVGDQPAIVQVYESGGLPDPVIETTVTVRGEEVDVLIGRRARPVGAEGLAVLERHGVPTSADQIAAASRSAGEPGALVTAVVIGLVSAMIISARAATGGIRRISSRSA